MMPCRLQWNLVLLNFMTCGLEICVAAGITYVPPLLLEAGVEEQYMTMVLGIGPVLGLIFVPLIGSASDNCQSNYGGRRPFIWLLSLGVLLSLFIIPHADSLASYLSYGGNHIHIFFLIFGVGLLDCCAQVCFTPLEALLSDLYHDDEGCGQAFAMFSLMISVGGCIGYLLTSFNWNYTYFSLYLGGQDECLFLLLTVIFVITVLVTMKTAEEHGQGQQALDRKPSVTSISFTRGCCIPKWKLRSWKCNPIFCLLSLCWSVTPRIYHSYCRIPAVMKQLCAAQLCSWMAVMSFMLFYTDFVGEGLYKGIPSAAPGTESRIRYDEGIRMGSLGLFLQCATSTFFSMIINKLAKQFGSRKVYLSSMITFTSSALVICLSQNIIIVTIMSSLTGFAYATLQTLPYTLICLYHKEKEIFMPRPALPNIRNEKILTKEAVHFSPNIPSSYQNGTHKQKGHNNEETIYITQELDTYVPPEDHPYYPTDNNNQVVNTDDKPLKDVYAKRGIGLDFATLDSTFLLSQVFPSFFMGMFVQLMENVTVYIASSVVFGVFAIYLANRVVFDQKDLRT
ncbi:solute carrier family 45 member 3-like [Bufo bufo]|uniref:solute carrier family 45 member 3-like n=1 Tax=Bufo bufo TaxID=8384 RepID=UPI001ABEBF32|nr:solute carrier family 45 member 3-like [Bufo bufo]XP_040271578.1 solute carrier family 45 member 3-like [Bufo bufo]